MNTAPDNGVLSIDLRIADPRWDALGDVDALAAHVLGYAANQTNSAGEVSILMTDNAEMHALNKQWRGFDKPTDVLSFPADGPEIPENRFIWVTSPWAMKQPLVTLRRWAARSRAMSAIC